MSGVQIRKKEDFDRVAELAAGAVLVVHVTTCQQCWSMVPKQYGEAHMYWHEKFDEQIGGDPDA